MQKNIQACKEDNCYCGLCKFWKNTQYLIGYCNLLEYNKYCSESACDKFKQEK